MTRIFTDDFESATQAGLLTSGGGAWTSAYVGVSTVTDPVYLGTYALRAIGTEGGLNKSAEV